MKCISLSFLQQVCRKAALPDPLINALSRHSWFFWQMVFVSDTGSQQKQGPGKRSQLSLCRANQLGYLTAYALLWPTPAEGWRSHHGPWTPPLRGAVNHSSTLIQALSKPVNNSPTQSKFLTWSLHIDTSLKRNEMMFLITPFRRTWKLLFYNRIRIPKEDKAHVGFITVWETVKNTVCIKE